MTSVHDFTVLRADGSTLALAEKRGRALLLVNTASRCGFTPQYAGLERLHRTLGPLGFEVLAFPCNQFGGQEPGTADEIASFCRSRFDVSFEVLAKVEVNGPAADPLWRFLRTEKPGLLGTPAIKWNFTKFLVDPAGRVVSRHGSRTPPEALEPPIRRILPR